jgi:hypothetical protein
MWRRSRPGVLRSRWTSEQTCTHWARPFTTSRPVNPPFGSGDALRLIHDHLARVPARPAVRRGAVPAALSEIIMHLLEKEPDSRYQKADGLLHDRSGYSMLVREGVR